MEAAKTVVIEHRCPECRQVLEPAGDMLMGESQARVPVYRCPSCIEEDELFGMPFDAPVTFAVLPNGELVRPGDWRG